MTKEFTEDTALPGMWESADFTGGATDCVQTPSNRHPGGSMNPALDSRARFEAHWRAVRGAKKAANELRRHPADPQVYINDSANRHFVTWQEAWQAAIASMAASQWRPLAEAPVDDIVLCAAEFDGPGDWRIKCGYLDKQTMQWRVFGASWEPTRWQPLPAPPIPQDPPIAALAAKETT